MSIVNRMMWEYAATEIEKDIKEGLEKSLKEAEKKAEKMKDKAKKSKDGKDAAAAKESAKDAKKLRKTVLKSIQKKDSANDRNIREEIGLRIIEGKWGTGDWIRKPVEKWERNGSKAWRKLSQKAKVNDAKVILSLPEFDRILTMRTLGSDTT